VLEDFVCQAIPGSATVSKRGYNRHMKTLERPVLDKVIDPLTSILTPEVAHRLVSFRFDQKTQMKIDKLARKCNEGRLSEAERTEYEAYVYAIDFIAILQAKARAFLKKPPGKG
jgi:hypothetical protein